MFESGFYGYIQKIATSVTRFYQYGTIQINELISQSRCESMINPEPRLEKSKSLFSRAKNDLEHLGSGSPASETQKIMSCYIDVEQGIALLKLHLHFESPDTEYRKKRGAINYRGLVTEANRFLKEALSLLEKGKYEEAITSARFARNRLKTIIVAVRRA